MKNDNIYKVYIDNPQVSRVFDRNLELIGWIIPSKDKTIDLIKLAVNGKLYDAQYGMEKKGVLRAYSEFGDSALYSGFKGAIALEEGDNTVEILTSVKGKLQPVHSLEIYYSDEMQLEDYIIDDLTESAAQHRLLIDNKASYFHEDATEKIYEYAAGDPRLVCFYLPQFHPTALNDASWGKGFTEWNNVASGNPKFVGHEQPKLPTDLGYYDLRLDENMKSQIDMAKKHGIYGFCFYYYWFSGERTLDLPLNTFLKHKEWDFNFMICWANENWTKRWDGRDDDVIISQKYLEEDPLNFIKDVEHILLDDRYIKNDGKPLLAVYRGSEMGDPEVYISIWREYFKKHHKLELEIVTMLNFDQEDPRPSGFDGGVEFEPMTTTKYVINTKKHKLLNRYADFSSKSLDKFTGNVIQYADIVHKAGLYHDKFDFPTYKSVTPSWDNDARKKGAGTVFYGSNPLLYGHWLNKTLERETSKSQSPLVFINAWNEWAEGAMLEPNDLYGHAVLNKTTEVLSQYSNNETNTKNFSYGIKKNDNSSIAVVVHAYYLDELDYIVEHLNKINDNYDLIISTRFAYVDRLKKKFPYAVVVGVPNRGRDILPFLLLGRRIKDAGYQHILKLHSKQSKHRASKDGDLWFKSLISELLPSSNAVDEILITLKSDNNAFVGPRNHYISLEAYMSINSAYVDRIIEDIDLDIEYPKEEVGYFAGSMYWCNVSAIEAFIDRGFTPEDFEGEMKQLDGTLAHAIERTISMPAHVKTSSVYLSSEQGISRASQKDIRYDYEYAKQSYAIKDKGSLNVKPRDIKHELARTKYDLDRIQLSYSYRIGKAILYIPRKAKKLAKKIKNKVT